MNNVIIYLLLLIGTLLGAFGGFYLKKSTGKEGISGIILSPFLYIGGFSYLISAVLNIIVLKYLPYSVVLPREDNKSKNIWNCVYNNWSYIYININNSYYITLF